MNKMNLAKKAYELYSIENLNADEIAAKLDVSRRTVFNWMKNFNWQKKSIDLKEFENALPTEIMNIASKMLKKVNSGLDEGRKVSNAELYSVVRIVEQAVKMEYDVKRKTEFLQKSPKPHKGLTPEAIKQIKRDILGINVD